MLLPSQAALAQSATGYGARQDPLTIPETLGGAEAGDRVLPADAAEQLSARATCETLRLHFHFKETRLQRGLGRRWGWHRATVTALPPSVLGSAGSALLRAGKHLRSCQGPETATAWKASGRRGVPRSLPTNMIIPRLGGTSRAAELSHQRHRTGGTRYIAVCRTTAGNRRRKARAS